MSQGRGNELLLKPQVRYELIIQGTGIIVRVIKAGIVRVNAGMVSVGGGVVVEGRRSPGGRHCRILKARALQEVPVPVQVHPRVPANVLEAYPEVSDFVERLCDEIHAERRNEGRQTRLTEHNLSLGGEGSDAAHHAVE